MPDDFEGPVDAGRAAVVCRTDFRRNDHDMIVITDAEAADQLLQNSDIGQHTDHTVARRAPTVFDIVAVDSSRDVALFVEFLKHVSDSQITTEIMRSMIDPWKDIRAIARQ
jgi:hypothetical protein